MSNRNRESIKDGWAEFERMTLPDDASNIQRREMRRAWYAGIGWFMTTLCHSLDEGTSETDGDIEYMESIEAELMDFASRIIRGIA